MRSALTLALLVPLALAATPASAATTGTGSDSSGSSGSSESGSTGSSDAGTTTGSSDAGSTGASESSTSTGSTGTEGSTGAADTGTTTAPSTDDGGCGCASGDDAIAFDEPADGAHVDAPFAVVVDIVPRCPCFDCSCAAEDLQYVQLFLDAVVWGAPCYASPCTWEVTGTLGEHLLYVSAAYPSGEASTSRTVVISSVDAGTTGAVDPPPTTAPSADDTGDGASATPSSDGCGCTATPQRAAPLGLLLLWAPRRRRVRPATARRIPPA